MSDATEDSASRNAGTRKVIAPAPGASIWLARAASWLPALGFSVALHAAAATWVALPWPNTSTQPPVIRPIQISLGVSASDTSDTLATGADAVSSDRQAAAEGSMSDQPRANVAAAPQAPPRRSPSSNHTRTVQADPITSPDPRGDGDGDRGGEKTALELVESKFADAAQPQLEPSETLPNRSAEARLSMLTLRRPDAVPALAESRVAAGGEPNPENIGQADAVSDAANQGVRAEYAARIQSLLAHHRRYPREARLRGQQGRARLFFVIDRHGRVVESRIEQSSGHALLDREVLAMVKRAQPLPPIPEPLFASNLDLIVPIEFSLR